LELLGSPLEQGCSLFFKNKAHGRDDTFPQSAVYIPLGFISHVVYMSYGLISHIRLDQGEQNRIQGPKEK
jgi:hypothetical protein